MADRPPALSRKALINTALLAVFLLAGLVLFFMYGRQVERLLQ